MRSPVSDACEVAIVGSGFAGSLLARVLAVIGYDVVLLERGTHPRFAIGESSTPLANLSLERIGARYGLADCYRLATHGRWLEHHPELRRGLKRGFTYYRHHPDQHFAVEGFESERLLVAASPEDRLSDTHWLRADVDHHFVRMAAEMGVDYRDRATLTSAEEASNGVMLSGNREGEPFELSARFVVDASGPGGFLARQLGIPSAVEKTETRSAIVYSHFDGVRLMSHVCPGLPPGPYADDWAAVHHLIDEGWMYSLRFDNGMTSAGILLTRSGLAALGMQGRGGADALWRALLGRYPTLAALFADARPVFPFKFQQVVQHRLARAAGERWVLMPHAYAFVDPLFSTGIAWGLLAVERLALAFENAKRSTRLPALDVLRRYDVLLAREADQIDLLVAGAYEAMAHFDLFAAQAMLYFATVSYTEALQRIAPGESPAWGGLLGVDDDVVRPLFRESLERLRAITHRKANAGTPDERSDFADWIAGVIAPRNIAGLADARRRNLYPVDLEVLIDRHSLLGLSRDQMIGALPALRGLAPEPPFGGRSAADRSTSPPVQLSPARETPAPR
jgi:tetracycline 7-halogenase / FADH2 O2-dependent halogenase